jgi:hypothetical protein
MGLLDDAIREHLELKRRRGADPVEVERAEQEALGPVRRAPEEIPHDELAPDTGPELGTHDEGYGYEESYDEPADSGYHEPQAAEPLGDEDPYGEEQLEPLALDPLEQETQIAPPLPDEGVEHAGPGVEEDPAAAPAPPVPPSAADSPPPHRAEPIDRGHLSEETAEYDIGEEPENEDMLEETPEFLQDTPEHDRLWFEQRPPRDFDFDD